MPDDGERHAGGGARRQWAGVSAVARGMIREIEVCAALAPLPPGCFLKHFVDYGAEQVGSHLLYHVGIGAALAGTTAPRNLVGMGFKAPTFANLFTLVCGKSGQAEKSLALGVARRLVSDAAPDLVGPDPTSDQALAKILEARPALLFPYGEGGKFLSMTAGVQNQVGQGIRKGFTDAFDGESYDREYSKGQKVHVVHPRPSLVLCCTPQDLEDCTVELDWRGGFLSRFFFCYCDQERQVIEPKSMPEHQLWLTGWLVASKAQAVAGECTGMAPDVRARWLSWQADMMARHADALQEERLVGIVTRTRLMVAKLATSLSWQCSRGWGGAPWAVEMDVLEAAIALGEIHLRSGLALAERIPSSWDMREQQRTLAAVNTEWTALGDIARCAQLTLKKTKLHIETLTEQGVLAYETQGTTVFYRRVPDGSPPEYVEPLPPPPLPAYS